MKRLLPLIIALSPCLMCFQCGCDEPDCITTLQIGNATDEVLYMSSSAEPWANTECRWLRLPHTIHWECNYTGDPGSLFRHCMEGGDTRYVLLVDGDMNLRACWSLDSLPTADSALWVSDTALLDYTNCNNVFPTEYHHTFTVQPVHLQ